MCCLLLCLIKISVSQRARPYCGGWCEANFPPSGVFLGGGCDSFVRWEQNQEGASYLGNTLHGHLSVLFRGAFLWMSGHKPTKPETDYPFQGGPFFGKHSKKHTNNFRRNSWKSITWFLSMFEKSPGYFPGVCFLDPPPEPVKPRLVPPPPPRSTSTSPRGRVRLRLCLRCGRQTVPWESDKTDQ